MHRFFAVTLIFFLICACSESSGSSSNEDSGESSTDAEHSGMLLIEASSKTVEVGTDSSSAASSEKPAMTVSFDYDFSIDVHEVTRKEYADWTGKDIEDPNSLPMTNVTYYDAVLAANARSKKEKLDTAYTYSKAVYTDGNCTYL